MNPGDSPPTALDSARRKAYWRILPLLFLCYVVAYVDRANVSLAKLTMTRDLPGFDNAVIGFGTGIFFLGYFLLEIPSSLLVEKWSARKLLTRIMVTWGVMAALTSLVRTPHQFYLVRFLLGLAEAGFFPGMLVYLTHWFSGRDRTRALAYFFVATPMAQIISPKISNALLKLGSDETVHGVVVHHAGPLGLAGWQWLYIFWGLPAIILGAVVYFRLTDRPADARWLTSEERAALEGELKRDRERRAAGRPQLGVAASLRQPKVLLLTAAYFCTVGASQGLELFLPSILSKWYQLKLNEITWLVMLPPLLALAGQLFVGWNSDRTKERRLHAAVPVACGVITLALTPLTQGHLVLTILCFMVTAGGLKAYLPAFWSLPNLFLTEAAAAGRIGLINSLGNLGGFSGQDLLGQVEKVTGSFVGGLYYLCGTMLVFVAIILSLGLGHRETRPAGPE